MLHDPFAMHVARLSLMLADHINHQADMTVACIDVPIADAVAALRAFAGTA